MEVRLDGTNQLIFRDALKEGNFHGDQFQRSVMGINNELMDAPIPGEIATQLMDILIPESKILLTKMSWRSPLIKVKQKALSMRTDVLRKSSGLKPL